MCVTMPVYVCIGLSIYIYVCVCAFACLYVFVCGYVYVSITHVSMLVYVCVCGCMSTTCLYERVDVDSTCVPALVAS